MRPDETTLGSPERAFPQTIWGLISRARDSDTEIRGGGLAELCQKYWKPVYCYIRLAHAKTNDDAKDLTQNFFLWLLQGDALRYYDSSRASFRTYLKSLVRQLVLNEDQAGRRQKRGGAVRILDLDGDSAKLREALADPKAPDPEKLFDEEWRNTIMTQAIERVRRKLTTKGQEEQFRIYEKYALAPPSERLTYAELAREHGLKESDIRNHLFLIRSQVREEVRSEILEMTSSPGEFEEEWNAFLGVQ